MLLTSITLPVDSTLQHISQKFCDETNQLITLRTFNILQGNKITRRTMNPSVLHKFLSVVKRDPSLVYIANAA